jgi:hypothetical protein
MTYAWRRWEYAADDHLLILQHPQNRVFHATVNLVRWTPVRQLHVAFKVPYMYYYIPKLCRTQAEEIPKLVNPNVLVRDIGQGEARHRKYKGLRLGGGQVYDRSAV